MGLYCFCDLAVVKLCFIVFVYENTGIFRFLATGWDETIWIIVLAKPLNNLTEVSRHYIILRYHRLYFRY